MVFLKKIPGFSKIEVLARVFGGVFIGKVIFKVVCGTFRRENRKKVAIRPSLPPQAG